MTKKIVILFLSGVIIGGHLQAQTQAQAQTQTRRIDTVAVAILDKMSAMIGELGSCSVTIRSNYDINSKELGLIKHSDEQQLFIHGPNQLLLKSEGDKGSRDFYFDGKTLTYYSMDKNQYGQIDAPLNVVEMIDTVNKLYGIDFPAADFFYPGFVDDILADSKTLVYLGLTKVDGKECFHVAGTTNDMTYQFWICNDAFTLPMKMVIIYTNKDLHPQYEATLSDWQVNPNLPDALFTFTVPHRARKVKFVPLTVKK
ncbi:MAG TPA: DUF2092 domain-containing protein [Puia sp.]|jgi:hypothetical protein|nr:DUF2092 domain-containing protein [Puia sp.]